MTRRRLVVLIGLLLGCRATTSRPYFVPFPEAETAELGFGLVSPAATVAQVSDTVLAYLTHDSIPITKIRRVDGFLESGWFDAATLAPTRRRPIGDQVVRVRAFIDPGRPGFGRVEIETVYVPFADPSLTDREQEAPVTPVHPVNLRVAAVLEKLKKKYGAPEDSTQKTKDGKPAKQDSTKARPAKPDSTGKRDTIPVKVPADTTRRR